MNTRESLKDRDKPSPVCRFDVLEVHKAVRWAYDSARNHDFDEICPLTQLLAGSMEALVYSICNAALFTSQLWLSILFHI